MAKVNKVEATTEEKPKKEQGTAGKGIRYAARLNDPTNLLSVVIPSECWRYCDKTRVQGKAKAPPTVGSKGTSER